MLQETNGIWRVPHDPSNAEATFYKLCESGNPTILLARALKELHRLIQRTAALFDILRHTLTSNSRYPGWCSQSNEVQTQTPGLCSCINAPMNLITMTWPDTATLYPTCKQFCLQACGSRNSNEDLPDRLANRQSLANRLPPLLYKGRNKQARH